MMKTEHELKSQTEFFARVLSGQKTFEIRKNDRDFQVGDILILRDYDGKEGRYIDYSPAIRAEIVYISTYQQQPGYVVMGIVVKEPKP